ncbi:MAG: hypothetical protein ACP5IL_06110 [Syntrophobacteraceae bacterium]
MIELWFDEDINFDLPHADIIVSYYRSKPLNPKGWLYSHTILINLAISSKMLLEHMDTMTVRQIRRAETNDGIECAYYRNPTPEKMKEFVAFYNDFATAYGLSTTAFQRLALFKSSGLLGLSEAKSKGKSLVWHAYLTHRQQGRALALLSASGRHGCRDKTTCNLISRANRLLHFQDMVSLKEQGYRFYDFGGWYSGGEDRKLLQINSFKERFGGRIVYGYDSEEPLSLRGRLYQAYCPLRWRFCNRQTLKEFRRRRREAAAPPAHHQSASSFLNIAGAGKRIEKSGPRISSARERRAMPLT